jgi:hypothetical protein
MSDRDIDDILKRAGEASSNVDPALLDRISSGIGSELQPVRPMPSVWVLLSALLLLCGMVGVAGAVIQGTYGLHKMDGQEAALIFSVLGIFAVLSAAVSIAEAIPGSRRIISPSWLVVIGCAALVAVFASLFHDYQTERFIAQGIPCLKAGLGYAIPAALGVWWILRRGFPVNAAASGLARGVLGGLAGVIMLELHCANFEAPHVIVWHTLVIPISGAIGAMAALALCKKR